MRRIPDRVLDPLDQETLYGLQEQVNAQPDFASRVRTAKKLWGSKGNAQGKKAFGRIRQTLKSMCVQTGICHYCEQSEATDIEHIHPKSFYPEKAFEWTNYLLACKICNTTYKLDKWYVLDDQDTAHFLFKGMEPPWHRGAFIQPRIEDPENYMLLNTQSFTFEILPQLNPFDQAKAEKTLEILHLNERDVLLQARKSAAQYFHARMHLLMQVIRATTEQEITALYSPYDPLPPLPFSLDDLKFHCKENIRKDIISSAHPSVWSAIRRVESQVTPAWQVIFQVIPEALGWE